eukprot:222286_1
MTEAITNSTAVKDTSQKPPIQAQPKQEPSQLTINQSNWKDRLPPRAPGLFPPTVDMIVNQCHQLGLTVIDFLVILTTIGYDGNDKTIIIIASIVLTLLGFAFYIKYICKHILIWDMFFRRIDIWYAKHYEKSKNDDHCRRLLLINVAWWLWAVLVFLPMICYSAYLCFVWYRNRRSDTNTDLTTIDFDSNNELDVAEQENYMKHALNTFSVSYLGLLAKQASYWMLFLQDIPMLIICCVIENNFCLVLFSCTIAYKLVTLIKHIYDVPGCGHGVIPRYEDFYNHFDLHEVIWVKLEGINMKVPGPIYLPDALKYKNRLRLGDMVKVFDKDEDEWVLGIVYKNVYNKKENLIVVRWDKIDHTAYRNGQKYEIPEEAVYRLDRWEDDVEPLNEEELMACDAEPVQHTRDPLEQTETNSMNDPVECKSKDEEEELIATENHEDDKKETVCDSTEPMQITTETNSMKIIGSAVPNDIESNGKDKKVDGDEEAVIGTDGDDMKEEVDDGTEPIQNTRDPSQQTETNSMKTVEPVVVNDEEEDGDKGVGSDDEEEELMGDDVVIVDMMETKDTDGNDGYQHASVAADDNM